MKETLESEKYLVHVENEFSRKGKALTLGLVSTGAVVESGLNLLLTQIILVVGGDADVVSLEESLKGSLA